MRTLFKNAFNTLFVTSLALTGLIHADDYSQPRNVCDVLPPECKQVSSFLNEWGVRLDSLYWKFNGDDLEAGEEIHVSRTGFDPVTGLYDNVSKRSKLKTPNFNYDSGFRILISHCVEQDYCDAAVSWTHFYTTAHVKGHSTITPGVPGYHSYTAFQPYWESLARNFPAYSKSRYSLELDLLDFDFGRKYDCTSCFTLRPFLGVRCARLNQTYKVKSFNAQNPAFDFNGASYNYSSQMKATCDFSGVGPRLGVDAEFKMGWGLTMFGIGGASLVYGKFDSHSHESFNNADPFYYKFLEYNAHAKGEKNDWRSRAITDLALGVKWNYDCVCGGWNLPIMIALAWEHHGFYDFNRFQVDADGFTNANPAAFDFGPYANLPRTQKKSGNLYTQGLTVATRIGF